MKKKLPQNQKIINRTSNSMLKRKQDTTHTHTHIYIIKYSYRKKV